jgi:hypothetical protein
MKTMQFKTIDLTRDEDQEKAAYEAAMRGESVPPNEETQLDRTGFELTNNERTQ